MCDEIFVPDPAILSKCNPYDLSWIPLRRMSYSSKGRSPLTVGTSNTPNRRINDVTRGHILSSGALACEVYCCRVVGERHSSSKKTDSFEGSAAALRSSLFALGKPQQPPPCLLSDGNISGRSSPPSTSARLPLRSGGITSRFAVGRASGRDDRRPPPCIGL